MNWLKRNFFRLTTILLFTLLVVVIVIAVKINKLENQIYLPSFLYSDLTKYGYEHVTVEGTLTSTGSDDIASPLNTVQFTCDNSTKECKLVQAEIFAGTNLSLYTEVLPIESWDKNFIIFKTAPGINQCVVWTYRIDRLRKELIGVREKADNYDYDSCMGVGMVKFEVKVVNGWDAVSKLRGYSKD